MNMKIIFSLFLMGLFFCVFYITNKTPLDSGMADDSDENQKEGEQYKDTSSPLISDDLSSIKNESGRIFDHSLGITIEYDRIVEGNDFIDIIQRIDSVRANKFRDVLIKAYIKDGSIVLLQTGINNFESISRIREVNNFISEQSVLKIQASSSNYMDVSNSEKIAYLFEYLDDKGWDAGKYAKVEKSMAFIEISPLEKGNKGNPLMVYLDENKTYPAFFSVSSLGKTPSNTPNNDLVYPKEFTIQRYYKINGIISNPEDQRLNPFYADLGTGIYVDEPTPEAIEKFGVLHGKVPLGQ